MLVMALEEYDEATGHGDEGRHHAQGRGRHDPARHPRRHRRGGAARLPRPARARSTCPTSPRSTASPRTQVIAELGDLIYRDPESNGLADRRRLPVGQRPGEARRRRAGRGRTTPGTPRRCGPCSPRTCCPATSTPTSGPRGYPRPTSRRSPPSCSASPPSSITIGHLKKDAVWSVEADYARRAVGRRPPPTTARPGPTALAARAGPEPEDARSSTTPSPRRPRGAGRQPGGDARRPREAEAHQGAVPVLGLRRPRPHRAAGADLQRHLQQPPAPAVRRLAPRLPRHEPGHHAPTRTRRTPSGGA